MVAVLTDTPGTNLAVCLAVQELAPAVRTVMRTTSQDESYERSPTRWSPRRPRAARVVTNLIETGVETLEATTGDLEILDITVAEDAAVADRRLVEVCLPRGSLVVSIADGESIAGPDTVLAAGRTFVVVGEPSVTDEAMNLFHG